MMTDQQLDENTQYVNQQFNRLADAHRVFLQSAAAIAPPIVAPPPRRPRFLLHRTPNSHQWAVHRSDKRYRHCFPDWRRAVAYLDGMLSRHAITNLLDRAEAVPGEYEGLAACRIIGDSIENKRKRIADVAHYRGLAMHLEIEEEDDPHDTTFYIRVEKKKKRT